MLCAQVRAAVMPMLAACWNTLSTSSLRPAEQHGGNSNAAVTAKEQVSKQHGRVQHGWRIPELPALQCKAST
jgi:hypothetical protein